MITRCLAIIAVTVSTCAAAKPWEECQFVAYAQPFYLSCWGDDGKHLYGTFIYAGILPSERPTVALQISRSWDGPWKTVTRLSAGKEILPSGPQGDASRLRLTLGAFWPYLRNHECGRVVLDTGEAANITLSKLLGEEATRAGNK